MRTILLVDENQSARDLYSGYISQKYIIFEASSAENAIKILNSNNSYIDLVLLDIRISGGIGSLLCELKKDQFAKIKLIVVSVFPVYEQKKVVSCADDYFDKLQGVDILIEKINEIFN